MLSVKFHSNWPTGYWGEEVDGRQTTDTGQKAITITHLEHSSGELKMFGKQRTKLTFAADSSKYCWTRHNCLKLIFLVLKSYFSCSKHNSIICFQRGQLKSYLLTFSRIQQICSRRLRKYLEKNLYKWKFNYRIELKTFWQKE